jgi:hypothetical protein
MAVTCASTGFGQNTYASPAGQANSRKEIAGLLSSDWLPTLIEDKRGQTPLEYVRPDTLVTGLIFGISQGVLILREAAFHLWKFESCDPMEPYRIHRIHYQLSWRGCLVGAHDA